MVKYLPAFACLIALSACSRDCPLPTAWVTASSLKPSPVPYTPKVIFYAEEAERGRWLWRGNTVTYEVLLREIALVSSFNPKPLLLVEFAEGHNCDDLIRLRDTIAKAAKCSRDGVPCIQGTMAEFEART